MGAQTCHMSRLVKVTYRALLKHASELRTAGKSLYMREGILREQWGHGRYVKHSAGPCHQVDTEWTDIAHVVLL
eukprot:3300700-Pyramimonas_sp.AAC.1